MAGVIATRYASAFADLLLNSAHGLRPEAELAQLEQFESLIQESPDLRNVLLSPAVQVSRKRVVVRRLAEQAGFSRILQNFLLVIVDHNRTSRLGEIRRAVQEQLDARLGLLRAEITSAQELDPAQRAQMEAELSRVTGKQVRADYQVEPALIGGAMVRIGSTVYDGSLRGQLQALRQQFAGQAG